MRDNSVQYTVWFYVCNVDDWVTVLSKSAYREGLSEEEKPLYSENMFKESVWQDAKKIFNAGVTAKRI